MNKEPELGLYDILQEIYKDSPYEVLLQVKLDLARNTLKTDAEEYYNLLDL